MDPVAILALTFTVITGLVGLYSRNKVQQVTIDLTEKFDKAIKEEKKSYAIKLQRLEDKIEKNEEMARVEYATKQELKKMEEHIDKRFDDLPKTLELTVAKVIKEVL